MCAVEDLPADLRSLARLVPEDVRAGCSPLELRLRCEYAASLIGDAEALADVRKAGKLRDKANRVLRAVSPEAYAIAHSRLDEELAGVSREGDTRRAGELLYEIRQLERQHPQVPGDVYIAAGMAALSRRVDQIEIPPVVHSKLFRRGRKR